MFTFVFLSPSPPSTTEIFSKTPKMPCLVPNISEKIQLNQKMLKSLLTNFLGSFKIRKDPTSDIGTLTFAENALSHNDFITRLREVKFATIFCILAPRISLTSVALV